MKCKNCVIDDSIHYPKFDGKYLNNSCKQFIPKEAQAPSEYTKIDPREELEIIKEKGLPNTFTHAKSTITMECDKEPEEIQRKCKVASGSDTLNSESKKGEKNGRWMGDKASKITLHKWVAKYKPKPKTCLYCEKERKLNLANMKNHNYTRNLEHYEWLCYSCHKIMDMGWIHPKKFNLFIKKLKEDILNIPLVELELWRHTDKFKHIINGKIDKLAGAELI